MADNKKLTEVIYWNAQGISNKTQELKAFLRENRTDILLLGETHLKPSHKLKMENYTVYRNDRTPQKGGGTAILIKNHIQHTELLQNNFANMETTGIQIHTNHGPINIITAYLSPNKNLEKTEIETIFDSNTPTLLMGDLNAKHPLWNSTCTNTKGTQLHKITQDLDLITIGPDEHTHIHANNGSTDTLDIAIMKNISAKTAIDTIDDLFSDHLPIKITLDYDTLETNRNCKIVKWEQYKQTIQIREINIAKAEDIDPMVHQLQQEILKALHTATTNKKIRNFKQNIPNELKLKIMAKKKLIREYKHTLHPDTKTKLNAITNEIKMDLKKLYNEEWNKKVQQLQVNDHSIWKVTKQLTKPKNKTKFPPINTPNGIATSSTEKVEAFADLLEETFRPNKSEPHLLRTHQQIEEEEIKHIYPNDDKNLQPVTTEELKNIIQNHPKNKAPGFEGITNEAIKNLPSNGVRALKEIINGILKHSHFPDEWKTAKIILIKKPNKPKETHHHTDR